MKLPAYLLMTAALAAQQPAGPDAGTRAEGQMAVSIDFGYRLMSGVGGDFNTYRSVVNLGEGPKLFDLDATHQHPAGPLWDRLSLRMSSWGGDPYNTARLELVRNRLYRFTADYRNIAYFNFLPSFADPGLERGIILNQRAVDTYRRSNDLGLELFPGHGLRPYVAYSRNSSRGHGITNFVLEANEYPVPHMSRDHSDNVRGGVRLEQQRLGLNLECGRVTYHIDHQVYTFPERNWGNVLRPVLGRDLFLDRGNQSLDVRGSSRFARGVIAARPVSWLDLAAQFQFSQPASKTRYGQNNAGSFVGFTRLQFYDAELVSLEARARQPHTSASFSAELRPLGRLRILEAWFTDRLHNAGSAVLLDQLLLSGKPLDTRTLEAAQWLALNYSQQEVSFIVQASRALALRAGHRYVWGDAQAPPPLVQVPGAPVRPELRRHAGLAGASLVYGPRLRLNADLEASPGDRSYFRTSLHRYWRGRARARYQLGTSLLVSASFSALSNQNPTPGIAYDFLSWQQTLALQWTPAGGKWASLIAEYTRYKLRSELSYRDPASASVGMSAYYDRGHAGTGLVEVGLPVRTGLQPKISAGGSLVVGRGSRPARYYQPLGRLSIPLTSRVHWYGEWRWYALTQPYLYLYEGFRNHQFVTGFRLGI